MEKGKAEGRSEANREMALKMLAAGEDPSRVSEFTGLSQEEVVALQGKD